MSKVLVTKAESNRREVFAQRYVLTGNATQSYLEAYATPKRKIGTDSAATMGWRMLRNVEVAQRIRELKILGHETLMTTFEETLQEIAGGAMFDPANMFDVDGKLLDLPDMDPATRKMVQEIERVQFEHTDEDGNVITTRSIQKVKYGKDKGKYLDMLMRFFNAYEEHQKAGAGTITVQQLYLEDASL